MVTLSECMISPITLLFCVFRFHFDDTFVSHQAMKVMTELVGWFMRPLEEVVNDFEVELRAQKAQVKDMLETAKRKFKAYKEQLVLGENFVR